MAEPFSSSSIATGLALACGVSLASFFPGVDGNALVGAFAGAAVFVLHAPTLRLALRISYFALSIVAGYLAAPELTQWLPIHEHGISAFIASAAVITLTHKGLDALNKLDLFDWLKRGRQPK